MKWWPLALLLLAAAASVVNLFVLFVGNMMSPGWSSHEPLAAMTFATIVVMTLAGLMLPAALGIARARPFLIALAVLVAGAPFVPRMQVAQAKRERAAAQAVHEREDHARLLADIAARKSDVAARIAATRAYSPEQAWGS